MKLMDKLDRHADLMQRMADTVGADLGQAMQDGRLSAEGLRSAVLRCTSCDSVGACEHWLEAQEAGTIDAAPGYCRNADLLERLQHA